MTSRVGSVRVTDRTVKTGMISVVVPIYGDADSLGACLRGLSRRLTC